MYLCGGGYVRSGAGVGASGRYAFLANMDRGLEVYEVSDPPTNIVMITQIHSGGVARATAVSGGHVYLANSGDGLRIYAIVPHLSIATASTNTLFFSWPAISPFALQQNSDLTPPDWMTLTETPVTINSRSQLVLPPPTGNMFYRLVSQ